MSRCAKTNASSRGLTCVAVVLCGAFAAGCGGSDGERDEGTAELIAFLSGEGPDRLQGAEPERYGELLAAQSVRASGYLRSGVVEPGGDGWSPIVREAEASPIAVDVAPWLAAGDIDAAGRFVPCAKGCLAGASVEPPADELDLSNLEQRVARATGAIARLAGHEVDIVWAPPSEHAVVFDATGTAQVNPRLLQLVVVSGQGAAGQAQAAADVPGDEVGAPAQQVDGEGAAATSGADGDGAGAVSAPASDDRALPDEPGSLDYGVYMCTCGECGGRPGCFGGDPQQGRLVRSSGCTVPQGAGTDGGRTTPLLLLAALATIVARRRRPRSLSAGTSTRHDEAPARAGEVVP